MISRQQVVNRLRLANYSFKQRGKRVEIYRQKGSKQRVSLSLRDYCDEKYVTVVLAQAGLSQNQIDEFIKSAVKQDA
jgi:hypothetical protein